MSTAHGERRTRLALSRSALHALPCNTLFELPGRPHVVYQIMSYAANPAATDAEKFAGTAYTTAAEAALGARSDIPFLFKAFETGQIGPKRLSKIHGGKPRMATIHEYLDWTVTAVPAEMDDELDFGGFRVIVVLPRYRCGWPAPGTAENHEGPRPSLELGAPGKPLPRLESNSRPLSAATVRSGPGYLEVPFVATAETKRGRGYCRCLVEAMEDVARACKLPMLMLCSTNDPAVKSTWHHLGFELSDQLHMSGWDVLYTDLVHLQSTTQMHKHVPPPAQYKPIVFRHADFSQRTYALLGKRSQPSCPDAPTPHSLPTKDLAAASSALNVAAAPALSSIAPPSLSTDCAATLGAGDGMERLAESKAAGADEDWQAPLGDGHSTQRMRRTSSLFARSSIGGASSGFPSQASSGSGSVQGKGKGKEETSRQLLDTAGKPAPVIPSGSQSEEEQQQQQHDTIMNAASVPHHPGLQSRAEELPVVQQNSQRDLPLQIHTSAVIHPAALIHSASDQQQQQQPPPEACSSQQQDGAAQPPHTFSPMTPRLHTLLSPFQQHQASASHPAADVSLAEKSLSAQPHPPQCEKQNGGTDPASQQRHHPPPHITPATRQQTRNQTGPDGQLQDAAREVQEPAGSNIDPSSQQQGRGGESPHHRSPQSPQHQSQQGEQQQPIETLVNGLREICVASSTASHLSLQRLSPVHHNVPALVLSTEQEPSQGLLVAYSEQESLVDDKQGDQCKLTAGNGLSHSDTGDTAGGSSPQPPLPHVPHHNCAAASGEACKGSPCGVLQAAADDWNRAKEQCVPPPFVTAYSSRPP